MNQDGARKAFRLDDPDSDILGLVDRGERHAALTALAHRYWKAIYKYCREELRDAALADDVRQQVFIEAHRDFCRFLGRSSLRTWLFAIARHRVLDAARKRRIELARHVSPDSEDSEEDSEDLSSVPDSRPSPDAELDEARLRHALLECVKTTEECVRNPLLLRYQQGFTFEELSEICRERPNTLAVRVSRALPELRKSIESRLGAVNA